MLVNIENISMSYVEHNLLNNISFNIEYKEKIAIIGNNGCGKSTLLKVIAGLIESEKGTIIKKDIDKIAYLPQEITLNDDITVNEFIKANANEEQEYEIKSIITKLGLTSFDSIVKNMSGGEKKKLMLAQVLVKPCELLILDEPTNHLDIEMVGWLEKYLIKFNKALLMVTHDRYFLEKVVRKIIELEDGQIYIYEGSYNKYLELKEERSIIEENIEKRRNSFLRKEIEWIKRGAQARETKDKRRIEQFEQLSNIKKKENKELIIDTNETRLGRKTIILDNISINFNNRDLIKDFSYILENDDRIGIVGSNGMGKSTLLNMLAGTLSPIKGEIVKGETVKIGYFKQINKIDNLNQRVIDYINEVSSHYNLNGVNITSSKMLENFMFSGEIQYSPISKLSGGERRRLELLHVLMSNPNVLLLDEPTNDLDIMTLTIFENFINDFKGAIIIVSHDRYLLDKVSKKIFEFTPTGKINTYNGNYSDYLSKREVKKETRITKENKKNDIKVKLTFNEEREFSTIEDEISKIEEKIVEIKKESEKYFTDYIKYNEILKEKEKLEQQLNDKIERWSYLTEKKGL